MAVRPRLSIHSWDIQRYRQSRSYREIPWQLQGAYRNLCDQCYLDGEIPDDPDRCAGLAGIPVEVMREHWEVMRRSFRAGRNQGWLRSRTVDEVRNSARKFYQKKAESGRIGGERKASKMRELRSIATDNDCSIARENPPTLPYSLGSSPGFSGELEYQEKAQRVPPAIAVVPVNGSNGNGKGKHAPPGYDPGPGWERFWARYPAVRDPKGAMQAWISVVDSAEREAEVFAGLERWEASADWAKGVYNDAVTWLLGNEKFGALWRGKPAPFVSESDRERQRLSAL